MTGGQSSTRRGLARIAVFVHVCSVSAGPRAQGSFAVSVSLSLPVQRAVTTALALCFQKRVKSHLDQWGPMGVAMTAAWSPFHALRGFICQTKASKNSFPFPFRHVKQNSEQPVRDAVSTQMIEF